MGKTPFILNYTQWHFVAQEYIGFMKIPMITPFSFSLLLFLIPKLYRLHFHFSKFRNFILSYLSNISSPPTYLSQIQSHTQLKHSFCYWTPHIQAFTFSSHVSYLISRIIIYISTNFREREREKENVRMKGGGKRKGIWVVSMFSKGGE